MSGLDLDHADALALTGRHSPPPSLPQRATRRTEAPDDGFGLAQDPAPAVPPPSFRLGSPPPRLGSPGPAGTGPGTRGLPPPGPGSRGSAPSGPGSRGLPPPGPDTPGLVPPGPRRPDPAAANPDPFGLRAAFADPAPAAETDADAGPGPAPGPQTAGTYRGLPRRIRQANLNPHLRDRPRAAAQGADADGTPPSLTRSPEEARNLVASLQSGWQRGRDSDVRDGEPADTAQGAGRQNSEAPRGEEALWMSRDWPDQASS
jgi:hypothetical protein